MLSSKVCKYCNESKFLIFNDGVSTDYQGNLNELEDCCCLSCETHYPENELINNQQH